MNKSYLLIRDSKILFGYDILDGLWTLVTMCAELVDHLLDDIDVECFREPSIVNTQVSLV